MTHYVPAVPPLSTHDIECDALTIIRNFYPGLLVEPEAFPVLDFFDHVLRDAYGLDTGVEPCSDGVEGITWPDGRVILSEDTYRRAARDEGRPRFTVVHEGYHGIKHCRHIKRVLVHTGELVLYRRSNLLPYRDPEWQADTFASAVLMPAPMVRRVAAETRPELARSAVVRTFKVSPRAAEVRLAKLGLS